jgi:O-antigen/teichoic acid export membrane protein
MSNAVAGRARSAPQPFIHDVALTGVVSAVTMVSLIMVTRWLAHSLGPDGFGAYGLARRTLSWVTELTTVPVGIALARYVATTESDETREAYRRAGILYGFLPNLLLLLVAVVAARPIATLLFRDPAYAGLSAATGLLVVGMATYSVVFAWYRGIGDMRSANAWQLWTLAIGPALCALLLRDRGHVSWIVAAMGGAALAGLVPIAGWLRKGATATRARLEELLRYGVPRMPSGIAFGGLLAVGPFLAPYAGSLREAGFLVAGQSLMRVVEGGTSAFGLVALPRFAAFRAQRRDAFVRDRVAEIVSMATHLGVFATVTLALWTPEIVVTWLGPEYMVAVPLIRVPLIATAPYLMYALLRSVTDALDDRAVNARNLAISAIVTTGLSAGALAAGRGVFALAVAGAVGFFVLALLTVAHLRRMLGFDLRSLGLGATLAVNAIAGVLSALAHRALASRLSDTAALAAGIALALVLFILATLALRWLQLPWVREVEARIRSAAGAR